VSDRVCARGAPGRGYCGRKTKDTTEKRVEVTCRDCAAAIRADEGAGQ
jgi:hypothetical protein